MENKHTPLPWFEHGWESRDDAVFVRSVGGVLVARVCYIGGTEPAEANAALIVKAVNNHERLVAALNEFLQAPDEAVFYAARTATRLLEELSQ